MSQTATVTCPSCLGRGFDIDQDDVDDEWCQQCDGAGLVCEHCGDKVSGVPDHDCDCQICHSIKELAELVATRAKRRIAELERLDRMEANASQNER